MQVMTCAGPMQRHPSGPRYGAVMRVIAGQARGRVLKAPAGSAIRPTADRVRQALFNALGSQVDLVGIRALDLFAGTGALGIEALSRGAAEVVFVDDDPAARRLIQENLRLTGFTDRGRIQGGDGTSAARGLGGFDVAFCDPPYRFEGWSALLDAIDAPLVVIESDREIDPGTGWRLVRSKRYGSTVVHFARRNDPVGGDAVEPGTPVTGTRITGTAVTESEQNT